MPISEGRLAVAQLPARATIDSGGEPPNNGGVNERVAKLEAVLPYLATKGDVADAKTSIITFGATFGGAMAAIVIAVLLFAINRAAPTVPVTPPSAQQPIVIQMPAPQLTPPTQVSPSK